MFYFFSFFFFPVPLILHPRNDQFEIFPTSELTKLKQAHVLRSKSLKQLKQEFLFCTLWCGMATVCKNVFILEWGRLFAKNKKKFEKVHKFKDGDVFNCKHRAVNHCLSAWRNIRWSDLKLRRSRTSHIQGCENVVDSSHSQKLTTALNAQKIGDTAGVAWGPLACSLTASLLPCLNVTHQQILISEVTLWCVFVCFLHEW